jgi:hypothetical protein
LAGEYFRDYSSEKDALATKALEYYQSHLDRYVTPERVGWQLVEVNFYKPRPATPSPSATQVDKDSGSSQPKRDFELTLVNNQSPLSDATPRDSILSGSVVNEPTKLETSADPAKSKPSPLQENGSNEKVQSTKAPRDIEEYVGRAKAHQILENALKQLRKGESFEAVAKKFSDGPGAEQGGWQTPARPDSIADATTAAALHGLAEGATSSIIETDHSVRVVRVVSRIPASHKPFEEVDESIQSRLRRELQKKRWNALLARSSIELPSSPPYLPPWEDIEGAL